MKHFKRSYKFCMSCGQRNHNKKKPILVFSPLLSEWWCWNCDKHIEVEWKDIRQKRKEAS